jgi:hypothetical protein
MNVMFDVVDEDRWSVVVACGSNGAGWDGMG